MEVEGLIVEVGSAVEIDYNMNLTGKSIYKVSVYNVAVTLTTKSIGVEFPGYDKVKEKPLDPPDAG